MASIFVGSGIRALSARHACGSSFGWAPTWRHEQTKRNIHNVAVSFLACSRNRHEAPGGCRMVATIRNSTAGSSQLARLGSAFNQIWARANHVPVAAVPEKTQTGTRIRILVLGPVFLLLWLRSGRCGSRRATSMHTVIVRGPTFNDPTVFAQVVPVFTSMF